MKEFLITGSLAFDVLLRVVGRFGDVLPPLVPCEFPSGFTAAYFAPDMRRAFGGCAGNIAYGLQQLKQKPILMAVAGEDVAPYRQRLHDLQIDDSYVLEIADTYTAQAVIISDEVDSQINIFHPGATAHAHQQSVRDLPNKPDLAMVSPNGREGMLRFGREMYDDGIPFVFDPGQAIHLFAADELREMAATCAMLIVNRDEYAAFEKIVGAPPQCAGALIVTRGGEGSQVFVDGRCYDMAAARLGAVVDTTGCGDAYRAGLLYGWGQEWEWPKMMAWASMLAGIKSLHAGAQEYETSPDDVMRRCGEIFGEWF